MVSEEIVCIFCGKRADIIDRKEEPVVLCRNCGRETDGYNYQIMFDQWLGDVRKRET